MAKCKNCNSEDYEIIYIEEYDYNGDYIRVLAKARCCECGKEFWVREYFDFDDSKNVQGKIWRTCVRLCPGRLVKKLTRLKFLCQNYRVSVSKYYL